MNIKQMEHHKRVIKLYFSEILGWLIPICLVLLIATILLCVIPDNIPEYLLIMIILFIWIIPLTKSRLYILYSRTVYDLKNGNIIQKKIQIVRIDYDARYNLISRGGSILDKNPKYSLITEDNEVFTVCPECKGYRSLPDWVSKNFRASITYCKNSKLVLAFRDEDGNDLLGIS